MISLRVGLIVGILSFLLVGCWDRIEVNDLALVMATGIDQAAGSDIRLTVQIATPTQGGQSASSSSNQFPFLVVSAVGANTRSAKQIMQEKLSRRIYMPHRRVLIIGEKLARRGIQPLLDQFTREPTSRLDTYVLIAKGTTANALMQISYPYEGVPMEAVREIERSKVVPAVTLRDLIDVISSGTMSPLLPAIEKGNQSNGKSTFQLNKTAVFRHDRLTGWLDDRKTREVIWLRKDLAQTNITVRLNQKTPGYISMNLMNNTVKILPKKEHGKLVMHVYTQAEGNIVENTTELDLMNPENDIRINQAFSNELHERMVSSLNAIQHHYKADVLEFAEILHKEYPKEWKTLAAHWDQEFPKLKVIIHATVKTHHIGMSGQLK